MMDDRISSESNSHFLITDDVLVLTKDDLVSNTPSTPSTPSTPPRIPSRISCLATTKRGGMCKNRPFCDSNYCKLHHKQFSLEKPDECPVCMESLENTDIPLKCGHWVHKDCLMKWKEDTCPICRTEIKFIIYYSYILYRDIIEIYIVSFISYEFKIKVNIIIITYRC